MTASRRNHTLGIINGMLVNLGNAFVDPFTVLPVFIATLGGGAVVIGFVSAAFTAGWFFPQVFVASMAQARRRVLPIYAASSVFRFLGFVGAGVSVYLIGPDHPTLLMASVITGLSINALAAGVGGVPFLEITSKTVPIRERGSFFAGRRVLGGALGVLAGLLIAAVLDGDPGAMWANSAVYRWVTVCARFLRLSDHAFPYDYGILIIIGGVITSCGVLAYMFVREPPAEHVTRPPALRHQIADGVAMLRRMPHYRAYLLMRVFYQLTAMAFPFYATYAYVRLGFSEASVGLFLSIWIGAGMLSNVLWGPLLDRRGNRIVFLSTAVASLLPPLVMLWLTRAAPAPGSISVFLLVASTFLINGFVRSGRFIANHTYLLESAPPDRRPLYVGFMNSLSFPFMLSPILGGIVAETLGFTTLFAFGGAAAVANIVISARLAEPRSARRVTADAAATPL
ncbi:MAG: MFS transporter [Candidatus Krumholzibacteria bacterium]|nr:MFS transporter [Candidatus Krumholzibacteria bacterium]MDH4336026.1 MFS transporter [Candidatus Krumholzibacteria bacterium]MDH5268398.1 MFS transporter [Candidatus Krumholzibacteria bacterium]